MFRAPHRHKVIRQLPVVPFGFSAALLLAACHHQEAPLQWSFRGSFRQAVELGSQLSVSNASQPAAFKLEGSWLLAARPGPDAESETILVDPELRLVAAGVSGQQATELETLMSEPFVVELKRGVLAGYHFREPVKPEVQALRRYLASLLQHPSGNLRSAGTPWPGEEWDGTGRYGVSYTLAENGELQWKQGAYRQLIYGLGERQRQVPAEQLSLQAQGQGRSRWDALGLLELERASSISVPLLQGASLRSEFTAKLKARTSLGPLSPELWQEALKGTRLVPVGEAPEAPERQLANQLRAKGRSLEQVLAEYREAQGGDAQFQQKAEAKAQAELIALLSQTPLLAAPVELLLLSSGPEALLLEALRGASNEESLSVLYRAASSEKLKPERRQRAAMALIQAPHPPAAALAWLQALSKNPDFREFLFLGTGSYVRHYREDGEAQAAERGVQFLRSSLRSAKNADLQELILLAIANSGDARLFGEVQPFLQDSAEGLRAASLQALRLMEDSRVEPILRRGLSDKSGKVISAALRALSRREQVDSATVQAVSQVASGSSAADLRVEAVLALSVWRAYRQQVLPLLASLAKSDPNERVRAVAAAHLQPG